MAAQALEAGKHVNSEVPVAFNMKDCWRIVVAQERTGLTYLLGDQARHAGHFQAWRDVVQGGQLGRVVYCEGEYIGYPWHTQVPSGLDDGRVRADRRAAEQPQRPADVVPPDGADLLPAPRAEPAPDGARRPCDPRHRHEHEEAELCPPGDRPRRPAACAHEDREGRRSENGLRLHPAPAAACGSTTTTRSWGRAACCRPAARAGTRPRCGWPTATCTTWPDVDWRYERTDAPAEAVSSGHRGADYYVQVAFRDALLGRQPLDFDVYQAMDTAAPAILAVESIRNGNAPYDVPDFRPSASRPAGAMPAKIF